MSNGTQVSEQERLRARFAEMEKQGLVDVRFVLVNLEGATVESVCGEVNRFYDAIDRGEARPLNFNDSHRV